MSSARILERAGTVGTKSRFHHSYLSPIISVCGPWNLLYDHSTLNEFGGAHGSDGVTVPQAEHL